MQRRARQVVRVEAHDRKRLEQLCRYITRPALSDERVQGNAAGQVELKLKTPWRDGTTHLMMSRRWSSGCGRQPKCRARGFTLARQVLAAEGRLHGVESRDL